MAQQRAWGGAKRATNRPLVVRIWRAQQVRLTIVEVDAQAVVRAFVGVVVEGARAVGWRGTVYSVSRGVWLSSRVPSDVAGHA